MAVEESAQDYTVDLAKLNIDETESSKQIQEKDDVKSENPIDEKVDEAQNWSAESLYSFIQSLMDKYKKETVINNLSSLKNEVLEQENLFRNKIVEAEKMKKFFNLLMQDQEKYFRYIRALPKLENWNVGVQVDFPSEMSSPITGSELSDVSKEKMILKTSNEGHKNLTSSEKPIQNATSDVTERNNPSTSSVEVIDLTDEEDVNGNKVQRGGATQSSSGSNQTSGLIAPSNSYPLKHPAPLPPKPYTPMNKTHLNPPPKPTLRISAEKQGIVLQWNLTLIHHHAPIQTYEIYGYQESKKGPISCSLWKKIGDVKALVLPMACTLTQFVAGFKYHFTIRAVDEFLRSGPYSDPASIVFQAEFAKAAANSQGS